MNTYFSVIAKGSTLHRILDGVADITNILLIVWLLAVLVVGTQRKILTGRAWLATALSIALVYIVKTVDGKLDLWERIDGNYSTHSALAAALAISLIFLDRPRRFLALGIFIAYEALIVLLGFHSILDLVSTLALLMPLIWLCHFCIERRRAVSAAGVL